MCGLRVGEFFFNAMDLRTDVDLKQFLDSRLPELTELFGQDALCEWALAHNNELDDNQPIRLPMQQTQVSAR